MKIKLVRATENDAQKIWEMQISAFYELFMKYQDADTNPANEPLSKTVFRLSQEETYFYYIKADSLVMGAIRVVDYHNKIPKRISPIFVLPQFRGKRIAQCAINEAERIHGSENWELATILQEKANCHLYEKMGYRQTGKKVDINEKMTLVIYRK